eukprot:1845024-Lingulodinium_polyedra.AAC.1
MARARRTRARVALRGATRRNASLSASLSNYFDRTAQRRGQTRDAPLQRRTLRRARARAAHARRAIARA